MLSKDTEQENEFAVGRQNSDVQPTLSSPHYSLNENEPFEAEEKVIPGIDAKVESVHNSKINIIAGDFQQTIYEQSIRQRDYDYREIKLLFSGEQNRIKKVFEPFPSYKTAIEAVKGNVEPPERIILIVGPKHSGKFAAAIHFGTDLSKLFYTEETSIFTYPHALGGFSIVDFIQNPSFLEKSIVILHNPFERGLHFESLDYEFVIAAQTELERKNSFLIITVNNDAYDQKIKALKGIHIISSQVQKEQFLKIFNNHIDWFVKSHTNADRTVPKILIAYLKQEAENLVKPFRYVTQIYSFFNNLNPSLISQFRSLDENELTEENKKSAFAALQMKSREAALVGVVEQSSQEWFVSLSPNEQLFAMLGVLFNDISWSELELLYELSVRKLRSDGIIEYSDPRTIGFVDILKRLHAFENEEHVLEFEDISYIREIEYQIQNRYLLIWSLVEEWGDLILKGPTGWQFWEARRSFGRAIGKVAYKHPDRLETILNKFAIHPIASVVSVAGYIFAEICDLGSENYKLVLKYLNNWARSSNFDLMWAVNASVWRVYESLHYKTRKGNNSSEEARKASEAIQKLWEIITYIAEHSDEYKEEYLQFELVQKFNEALLEWQRKMGRADSPRISDFSTAANIQFAMEALNQILSSKEQKIAINQIKEEWNEKIIDSVGVAIQQMSSLNTADAVFHLSIWLKATKNRKLQKVGRLGAILLYRVYTGPNIHLIHERHGPLIDLIGPMLSCDTNVAFEMIEIIQGWIERNNWTEKVLDRLNNVLWQATTEERWILRNCILFSWFRGKPGKKYLIGAKLIARSYALDGAPFDPPTHQTIIGLPNTSQSFTKNFPWLANLLFHAIRARSNVTVLRLGDSHLLNTDLRSLPAPEDFKSQYPRSPLIGPLVDKFLEDTSKSPRLILLSDPTALILDLEDLLDTTNDERMLVVYYGDKPPVLYSKLGRTLWISTNQAIEHGIDLIDINLSSMIGLNLARIDNTILADSHLSLKNAISNGKEGVIQFITSLVKEIKRIPIEETEADSLIEALYAFTWLLREDQTFSWSINLLCKWLSSEKENNFRKFALAGSCLFFHIFGQKEIPITKALLMNSFRLTKRLLTHSKDSETILLILMAYINWIWNENLMAKEKNAKSDHGSINWKAVVDTVQEHQDDQKAEENIKDEDIQQQWDKKLKKRLFVHFEKLLMANVRREDKQRIRRQLQRWSQSTFPIPVRDATSRMLDQLTIGMYTPVNKLLKGEKYGLIMLDTSQTRKSNDTLIALQLWRTIQSKREEKKIIPLVFRLGQLNSVSLDYDASQTAELYSKDLYFLPALAGPILEQFDSKDIAFVLWIGHSAPLDIDDWIDAWKTTKILIYTSKKWTETWPILMPKEKTKDAIKEILDYFAIPVKSDEQLLIEEDEEKDSEEDRNDQGTNEKPLVEAAEDTKEQQETVTSEPNSDAAETGN